jgi:cytochrome c oxidase subunit 3
MAERAPARVDHFQDLEQETRAAHLGMWVFLASEVLLFAALFALYASYRAAYPEAFGFGVAHGSKILGTANTVLLICSSYAAASAVHAIRAGHARRAAALLAFTVTSGLGFLAIKGVEYAQHFREGIFPGGHGAFFAEHPMAGLPSFYTVYFLMTGLHGVHVIVGMGVLTWMLVRALRGQLVPPFTHPLVLGVLYWHLVDIIWIFLWPLFYLLPGGGAR